MNAELRCDPAGPDWPSGPVGYVAIVGRPNAGKSTFLNTVLETHLAPVSRKAQTTRRRLLGIYTASASQILFLDAPGLHAPRHALDEAMVRAVEQALADADLVLCLADATRSPGDEDRMVIERLTACGKPVLVAVNKVDAASKAQTSAMTSVYREGLPQARLFPIVALVAASLEPLLRMLKEQLPQGPFLFPPEQLTDSIERVVAEDLIREAMLEMLQQEVPHSVAVTIQAWREADAAIEVEAVLHVERATQKPILLGRDGSMIRALRERAAAKLTAFCGRPVRLTFWVKVDPDWRRRRGKLREFGLS